MSNDVDARWRAWRVNGQRFTSEQTSWRSLPGGGLVGVVVHGDDYRKVLAGKDWYYVEDGEIKAIGQREGGENGPGRGKGAGGRSRGPPAKRPQHVDARLIKRGAPVPDHVLADFDVDFMEARQF